MTSTSDVWAIGDGYESYVGRWSRAVAREFVAWLALPPHRRWLDVGCGTGALSEAIIAGADPSHVIGIEPSEGFVDHTRRHIASPLLRVERGDARALPVADASFDAIVSGLVLNFVPDMPLAVREMRRAASDGGVVAAYVWDYAGEMQLMRRFWDAAVALDPAAAELDEAARFPICQPHALVDLFTSAGLDDVAVRAIDIPTVFASFDDYWTPFLGGQGPAPTYCMASSEERRARLRERLRATLQARPDASIHLVARAWAVRGVKSATAES